MTAKRVVKQPYESFPIYASIYKVGASGEQVSLASSAVTARDKSGRDVTATLLDASSKSLSSDPRGGTNNVLGIVVRNGSVDRAPYTVTFRMTTTLAYKYEVDVRVAVEETTFAFSTTTTSTSSTTSTTAP